jgi:hypothetical protein
MEAGGGWDCEELSIPDKFVPERFSLNYTSWGFFETLNKVSPYVLSLMSGLKRLEGGGGWVIVIIPPVSGPGYRHCGQDTGRQPPPLSSVLYRIIYKRHSVVAAQVLLREKSGA